MQTSTYISRRHRKKPIFDDNNNITQQYRSEYMSQSMDPHQRLYGSTMFQSQHNFQQSESVQKEVFRKRERIFQYPKQPISISKTSLINLRLQSQSEYQNADDDFHDISYGMVDTKPIHFQLDNVVHRQHPMKSDMSPIPTQVQVGKPVKNDKLIMIGIGCIVIVLIVMVVFNVVM